MRAHAGTMPALALQVSCGEGGEMAVASIPELDELVARVKAAQLRFGEYTQEQVDLIFRGAALAAADARIPLARMAAGETGMGVMEDKVIKNHFASEYIYNAYKDEKTAACWRWTTCTAP